jgi:hypothetical protein
MIQPTHDASSAPDLSTDASQPFVGRWQRLVSTTNWEKGRIIHQWRTAMIASDAPASEYSDEAWSRWVGAISGQHVGRLRRVYDRFGAVCEQYEGLYWSHFQAALDWDDAEMWLEGAVQNQWSVSRMRRSRWETLGALEQEPQDHEIVSSEVDEDFEPSAEAPPAAPGETQQQKTVPKSESPSTDQQATTPDAEVRDAAPPPSGDENQGSSIDAELQQPSVAFVRPFENLSELPPDVSEAFESYKLAIIRHKAAGWEEVSRDDLLASLDALKELALAPSDASADQ